MFESNSMFYGEFNNRRKEYSDACKWLSEEIGFSYKSTRMGDYERLLKTFINPEAKLPAEINLLDDFYLFMQATTEACQIIRLWNTFKSQKHEGLKDRIKQVMSGKSLRSDAIKKNKKGRNDDPARDFAFELNIASRFLKGGYKVDLTSNCDVVVDLGKYTLFVECKRIKSLKKLTERIKVASKQIDKRIGKNRKNKYGLIALDITDIILSTGSVVTTNDINLFNMKIKQSVTSFVREHQEISDSHLGRNALGILFEFSSSAFIHDLEKPAALGFGRSACILRGSNIHKKSQNIINDFIDKIANQDL